MPEPKRHKKSTLNLLMDARRLLDPTQKKKLYFAFALSTCLMLLDILGVAILIRMVWSLTGVQADLPVAQFFSIEGKSELFILGMLALVFLMKNITSLLLYRKIQQSLYQISQQLAIRRSKQLFQKGVDFEKTNSSKEVNHLFNLSFFFPDVILTSVIQFFNELLISIVMILLAVQFSGSDLLYILLGLLPLLFLGFYFIRKKLGKMGDEINQRIPQLYDAIQDNVHGNADIRLSLKSTYFVSRLMTLLKKVHRLRRKSFFTGTQLTFRLMETFVVVFLLTLYWINQSVSGSEVMIAQLSALGVIGFRMIPSFSRMLGSANQINQHRYVLEGILTSDSSYAEPATLNFSTFEKLEFHEVSFSYDDKTPLIHHLSFDLRPGEILGISGQSGVGKSSLAALIAGLKTPSGGEIRINDTETKNIPNHHRIRISMVQQEIYLLHGNIAQNIALSYDEPYDVAKMDEVIQKSALMNWVGQLPKGKETPVGELGNLISGGQKQRIAIARALYHDADIIVFDEATRALDSKIENEILQTLQSLAKEKRSIVIISHNKDVLAIADKIIDLDKT